MIKKIFLLWDRHTVGFCRVLFIATICVGFSRVYADILCCLLLIMWLIIKTGYEKKWNTHPTEKGGEG